jgi:hypothetical protein
MTVAFPPGGERHPTSPAPGGRFALIIPAVDVSPGVPIERFDAGGHRLTD